MTDRTGMPTAQPRRIAVMATLLATLLFAAMLVPLGTSAESRPVESPIAMAAQEVATPADTDGCDEIAPGASAEPWVRTELYFGTTMPDGSEISAEQWQAFLDEEITPRFPAGLTVLEGYGQFLNASGVIIAEESIVLIIFYPAGAVEESSARLEEIRDAFETEFEQESVLRADSAPVCISF